MPALMPLTIPPGHRPAATSQNTGGAWWAMNGVRFTGGILRPTGGWMQIPDIQLQQGAGPDQAVQAILAWRDNSTERWIAAASYGQIQVYDGSTGYDITPAGYVAGSYSDSNLGYGLGDYGVGLYGEPQQLPPGQVSLVPEDTVSFDTFGEELIAMGSADGRLLRWSPSTDGPHNPMQVVANAPAGRLAKITAERYGVVIGASGDPRRVSWSDEEDLDTWTPTITNQAGSLQLQSQGVGIAAGRVREGLLIWATDDLHLLQFLGPPFAYGLVRVGQGCPPAGPRATVATLGVTAWMGANTFWQWRGMPTPLPSPVQDYVFNRINRKTMQRTCGFHNAIFPEITWFYPSEASFICDSYVSWDYTSNAWSTGSLIRTAAAEPGANGYPMTGDQNGFLYQHEYGYTDNGNPRWPNIYAETGDIQLGAGDQGLMVTGLLPDATNLDVLSFGFTGQWAPGDVEEEFGPFVLTRTDGVVDTLFEARSVRLRVEPIGDQDWGLGRVRLWVTPGSGR
jgi:hypothetical protein